MSPRYFSKMYNRYTVSKKEREMEERVENAIKHVVAIIAVPIKKIIGKQNDKV